MGLTHGEAMLSSAPLMNDELGEKTRILLRDFITSFEMLEVFLLLRAAPEQSWTAKSVSARVHVADDLVARALEALHVRRLVHAGPPFAPGEFRYGPATAELAEAGEELARDFAERRAAVLSTLSTNAIERLRSGALSAFADAFILGSKRKDG
jgi:hypothetical protein